MNAINLTSNKNKREKKRKQYYTHKRRSKYKIRIVIYFYIYWNSCRKFEKKYFLNSRGNARVKITVLAFVQSI